MTERLDLRCRCHRIPARATSVAKSILQRRLLELFRRPFLNGSPEAG